MFLGIEIGGTKLQLGVGAGDGTPPAELVRHDVDPARGATGILEQIDAAGGWLLQRHRVRAIGVGFGGPVDAVLGRATTSHQIAGWDGFPLGDWLRDRFQVPAFVENDCNAAALAEARFGAGREAPVVLYVTVGTGIGGGLVIDKILLGANRPAVAEIGHLRPGLHADRPEDTVESLASGWGIAAAAQARLTGEISRPLRAVSRGPGAWKGRPYLRRRLADVEQADAEYAADLKQRCGGDVESLTAQHVAQAAMEGNEIACDVLSGACQALGWAIAQTITLVAPHVVVVGGGVSLIGEPLFFAPLREAAARYVFPPLADSYRIVPAALGELVVVHGALAVASERGG